MKRRNLVLGASATGFTGTLPRSLRAEPAVNDLSATSRITEPPPNILVIIVDQMRYPSVFPADITHVGGFLPQFMPNLYNGIWKPGVKFTEHYSAASPCSPSRAALVTGLYAHQSWMLMNVDEWPYRDTSRKPALESGYPTYRKLLRSAGTRRPFVGKWHLSAPPKAPPRLKEYGFEGLTCFDPFGQNLEGRVGDRGQRIPE